MQKCFLIKKRAGFWEALANGLIEPRNKSTHCHQQNISGVKHTTLTLFAQFVNENFSQKASLLCIPIIKYNVSMERLRENWFSLPV